MTYDFLFCLWDGGGAVPPDLSVARALVERGHRVRALADDVLRGEVEAAGVEWMGWTRAPNRTDPSPAGQLFFDHEARTPSGAMARARDAVVCGRAADYASDVAEELARERPDVLVPDGLLLGARIPGEAAGVPVGALFPNPLSLPGWGSPPFGPGVAPARGPLGHGRDRALHAMSARLWNAGLPAVNQARAEHGLPPADSVFEELGRADRVLLLTARAFEYPVFAPPPHVKLVGPRLDDPVWAGEWTPPPGDAPLVLVGLSSTVQGQEDLLRRCVAALGTLPVRGLVTTGPSVDPESLEASANVTVVEAAPHAEVLRHAAAVVTHAGHGTTIKALAAGVPLVCLPMGRDQLENAARVAHAGAGVRLRPGARPGRIASALRRVLDDPAPRAAARRLAAAIAEEIREDRAVLELEALAARTQVPATVT